MSTHPMLGDLTIQGNRMARAGFMIPQMGPAGIDLGPSIPILTRGADAGISTELLNQLSEIKRGEFTGDVNQVLAQIGASMQEFQRAITSSMPHFPVRENLESEAKVLVPLDTPVRNRLPRHKGSGRASDWFQAVSLGGGYARGSKVVSHTQANPSVVTLETVAGLAADQVIWLYDDNGGVSATIASVDAGAKTITLDVQLGRDYDVNPYIEVLTPMQHPGSPIGLVRSFFAETGAPAEHTTIYTRKSAGYRLLGTYGSVSGFAMASGANFQAQLSVEKANAIRNLMLNEENAFINGDASSTAAPWGDGTNALAFNGLVNLISTANGTPPDQVQAAVGSLTTAHIDNQLRRLYNQGAQGIWMVMNPQEILSLVALAEASGSIIRVQASSKDGKTVLGVTVTGYVNPVTGELVDIMTSRFLAPGTALFMSDRLPDGTPTCDVDVLPQVQLPELAPNESIQGYVAQELAPTHLAPQVYAFICSVYEVIRMKSARHVAKSTGLTPA